MSKRTKYTEPPAIPLPCGVCKKPIPFRITAWEYFSKSLKSSVHRKCANALPEGDVAKVRYVF